MKPVFSSRIEYGASPQPVQIDKFQKPSVVHTISRTLYSVQLYSVQLYSVQLYSVQLYSVYIVLF